MKEFRVVVNNRTKLFYISGFVFPVSTNKGGKHYLRELHSALNGDDFSNYYSGLWQMWVPRKKVPRTLTRLK